MQQGAPPEPVRAVPIIFREGQPTRPFVQVRVGAAEGLFLLDTGAAGHVMSDGFFRAAFPGRALTGRRAVALDFSGVRLPMTLVGDLGTAFADGHQRQLEFSVGSFSVPGELEGLAGVLSPQALRDDGSVELDFPGRQLRWWRAPPTRGVGYSLAAHTLRACRGGTRDEVIYAWATGVEGEAMWAMMDTGAPVTAVSPRSVAGQRLMPASREAPGGRGVSNAPVPARVAPARVSFGGVPWEGQVAIMGLPLEDCGALALLGMNVLRHCSVVLSGETGTVLCSP